MTAVVNQLAENSSHFVELNDLPLYTPWAARTLGLTQWTGAARTVARVDQEYDNEKYGKLLERYRAHGGGLTPEDMQTHPRSDSTTKRCVSIGEELRVMTAVQVRDRYHDLLCEAIEPLIGDCQTVIELGAGYGYNLWRLKKQFPNCLFWGGEYSRNAVELAGLMYPADCGIRVVSSNFYDSASYRFIDQAPGPVLLLTSHAIEQLPSAAPLIDNLSHYKNRVRVVVHCEPVYELFDQKLLGMMRRRYVQMNDYNQDLLAQLRRHSWIRIRSICPNIFGTNPLNPASIITWEYTDAEKR